MRTWTIPSRGEQKLLRLSSVVVNLNIRWNANDELLLNAGYEIREERERKQREGAFIVTTVRACLRTCEGASLKSMEIRGKFAQSVARYVGDHFEE